MSDPLYESSAKRLGELPVTQAPFGAFSPVMPVPDEAPSTMDIGARDWGDVHDDVMALLERYNEALELLSTGRADRLGHVKDCMDQVEAIEKRLRIRWDAHGLPSAARNPRRWRYRVC